MNTRTLLLENGKAFSGIGFGQDAIALGELVFTTGMTGYLETLTDPSYYGQIVMQTFPLIGNYGVIEEDFESARSHVKAYIVREPCAQPSNFRSTGTLDSFLKAQNIVGLYGVDTRELTKIVREYGVMNAKIFNGAYTQETLEEIKSYRIKNAVYSVGGGERGLYRVQNAIYHVVLWDFGAKANIIRQLNAHGCNVTVVPAHTSAQQILSLSPDGVMLSNGPGDPAENTGIIAELKRLCAAKLPMFGICLGHQLLSLACGATTCKLKYGHRGANQPVKDNFTNRVYITSQNHGYAVVSSSLSNDARLRFVNANDGTCEGIEYGSMPAFSVQFHPEAAAGPHDTAFLFDQFISLMKEAQPCR